MAKSKPSPDPGQDDHEEYETIPNPERGCGYLDSDATYLRADVEDGPDGLPAFVEFETPIPFKDSHFRAFKRLLGTDFLLSATQGDDAYTSEKPEDEVIRHIQRVSGDSPTAPTTVGHMPEAQSTDLVTWAAGSGRNTKQARDWAEKDVPMAKADDLPRDLTMWVGGSDDGGFYPWPDDFIEEAREHGVNKKIPMTGSQDPPRVHPYRTRLFLVHPRAIPTGLDEEGNEVGPDSDSQVYISGLIGYTYLTRVIHTLPVDGQPKPKYEQMDATGKLDLVRRGEEIPDEEVITFTPPEVVVTDPGDARSHAYLLDVARTRKSVSEVVGVDFADGDDHGGAHPLSWDYLSSRVDGDAEAWRLDRIKDLKYNPELRPMVAEIDAKIKNPSRKELTDILMDTPAWPIDLGDDQEIPGSGWVFRDADDGTIRDAMDRERVYAHASRIPDAPVDVDADTDDVDDVDDAEDATADA